MDQVSTFNRLFNLVKIILWFYSFFILHFSNKYFDCQITTSSLVLGNIKKKIYLYAFALYFEYYSYFLYQPEASLNQQWLLVRLNFAALIRPVMPKNRRLKNILLIVSWLIFSQAELVCILLKCSSLCSRRRRSRRVHSQWSKIRNGGWGRQRESLRVSSHVHRDDPKPRSSKWRRYRRHSATA